MIRPDHSGDTRSPRTPLWVPPIMQREGQLRRLTTHGNRTDDGGPCTVVLVQETIGRWGFYPHGDRKLGVYLSDAAVAELCRTITDGSRTSPPAPWEGPQ